MPSSDPDSRYWHTVSEKTPGFSIGIVASPRRSSYCSSYRVLCLWSEEIGHHVSPLAGGWEHCGSSDRKSVASSKKKGQKPLHLT
ncbi:Piso0_004628 [Millerozyma farinosa CBS 7064]|uniref:Piso0_004628 protein n=1 Tax=Pichia sorbitophila (strain ATCC MYA-4447 / BCRC 22081 / CBS 7064 / NBRC 10061 / NRRL Y-12695) TaxID=559304 RepID=G8Y9B2_PICSO|nr:Piso0_004628 [Millerozyma farinosa CBS 7064]CCE85057.1 Piso0_004628 [Millerozyma farinosa CBS 7064]